MRFGTASAIRKKAAIQPQPVVKSQNLLAGARSKLSETIDACLDESGLIPSTESPDARIDLYNHCYSKKAFLAPRPVNELENVSNFLETDPDIDAVPDHDQLATDEQNRQEDRRHGFL